MLSLGNSFVALASLILILDDVLLLQLAHTLDLVKVYHEALVVAVQRLDALPAENVKMIRAVEVLDALWVNFAELVGEAIFILILKVEARRRQNRVLFHNFVQNVDVQRQALCAFEVLDKLAADRASDAVLMVQLLNAVRAEGVPAVDQDARDALSNIVLETAELANIQAA